MKILFVTGADLGFFNSLLVFLQSFAERLPGQALVVCDFGFVPAQAAFLSELGVLAPRPAELASRGVFSCKGSLLRYLRNAGQPIEAYDAVVWLDADLTLMQTGIGDFEAVVTAMQSAGAGVALCAEPGGRSLGTFIDTFSEPAKIAPFARMIADAGLPRSLPYFSSGLFFCRAAAVPMLEHWMTLTLAVAEHPLFEQNAFNVSLLSRGGQLVGLDCEEWQAQGPSLDRVRLVDLGNGARPAARIGDKNIKTLHATSPSLGHLLIAHCRVTVRDRELAGPFKLFLPEALRVHQLQLLASFILTHGERLQRLRLCTRAAEPVEGYRFVTL
ncbi:MAG TPA: hypothetical protein VH206_06260 [Xanthobacteraceae bacterium]|jgi:hypothetical protein|nr:hypothetical protein [Xanthobacteraceae bacterium]